MLTIQQKNHIKDILSDGLGIKPTVNLAFYLDAIYTSKNKIDKLNSKIDDLERKIDSILRILK